MVHRSLTYLILGTLLACWGGLVAQETPKVRTENEPPAKNPAGNTTESELERFLKERGYTGIPLERGRAGSVVVAVSVGEKRLRLVCDTGATFSMLDEKRTKELKIDWEKSEFDVPAAESDFAKSCKIEVVELGTFRAHGLKFHSFDTTNGNKRLEPFKDPPVDGLLGWDVLKDYSAIIDVRALRLYLRARH
jgi:predicted aspartyl protease